MDKYEKIEKFLTSQKKFHISLGLERVKSVLKEIDNPQNSLKIIHVAGTNGKGSTCAMISKILSEQGYKVGLYTSPHLVKYNERISINGINIYDENFLKLLRKIEKISSKIEVDLTEFEILTVLMFTYFKEQNADFAVVEVGLGGRFDATNCIDKPILSVITSISKDHTERLGNTIEKIAFEKAGIIKPEAVVVCDLKNSGFKVIKKVAKDNNSPLVSPAKVKLTIGKGENKIKYEDKTYNLNLLGDYQKDNAALVLCAINELRKQGIRISEKSVENALSKVNWCARFQYIKDKNIILDGCHNPDGAKVLKNSLNKYFPDFKKIFVYTSLKNKDYKKIQANLFEKEDKIYHFDMKSDRFLTKDDVVNCIESIDIRRLKELISDYENRIKRKELLIICGSLYALGDILGRIKLCS